MVYFKSFDFFCLFCFFYLKVGKLNIDVVCSSKLFFTAGLFEYIMIVEPRPDGSLPGHMLFVFHFAYISSS